MSSRDAPPDPAAVPDPARIGTTSDLGRELTLARVRAGLTIRQLAKTTGILPSTLGGYFSGRHRPPAAVLERVLLACGIGADATAAWQDAVLALRRPPRRAGGTKRCPYRGLESYSADDAADFHGRTGLVETVLGVLGAADHADAAGGVTGSGAAPEGRGGIVVVVGPSGVGKSSLLRAGVVPALRDREGAEVVVVTPGRTPLATLADLPPAPAAVDAGPVDAGAGARPVVVVDQFEEVFAPDVPVAERVEFVAALLAAPVRLVLGLRADFYAPAVQLPGLAAALQHRQVVVGPLGEDELREVITAPAAGQGVPVEDGLVELLLADVRRGGSGGSLPLLSHALLATWERSGATELTVAHYRAAGGLDGAVSRSAEEAVAELGAAHEAAVRRLFLRLVTVAPGVADTRRRVTRGDLPASVPDVVVEEFVARRLLVLGGAGEAVTADDVVVAVEEATVEIAHEALISAWPRLQGWLDEDRSGAVVRRQTAEAARAWRDSGEDPDLLPRGSRLAAVAVTLRGPLGVDLNELEQSFLLAAERRERAQQAAARRGTRRLRRLVAALAVLVLLTGGLAVFGAVQSTRLGQARDVAVSRQVAVRADALRGQDPALAAQLAVAAYRIAPTTEARSSLLTATGAALPARMPGFAALTSSVAVDRGRGVLASLSGGEVQLRRAVDAGPLGPPIVLPGGPVGIALSPDGTVLAAAGDAGVVTVDVSDPARPGPPVRVSPDPASGVAVDAAGLVVAGPESGVRRPVPDGPGAAAAVLDPDPALTVVASSPDGRFSAAGGNEGRVLLIAGSAVTELYGAANQIRALAFAPDGRTLAAGSGDGSVYLWDLADPAVPAAAVGGAASWVNAVAFSPDGALLAAASSDGTTRLHDLASGAVLATHPHPAPVTVAVFTGDQEVVTAAADGTGYRWPVRGPVLAGFGDSVFALAFDASGQRLAIGPGRGANSASLWSGTGPPRPLGPPVPNPPDEAPVSGSAALTRDGALLAVGRVDGSVRLWDVRDPAVPVPLGDPVPGGGELVEQLAIDAGGRTLAVSGDDHLVRLVDITDPAAARVVATLDGATSYVFASTFSPDGTLLAAAGADGTTHLWDVRDPAVPQRLPVLDGPGSFAYSPAFSPDGRTLAVGSADRTVRLWDVTDPAQPRSLGDPLDGPANYVYTVAFAPDGRTLAAASTDGTVWTWDVTHRSAPERLAVLSGPAEAVYTVAWSPDGTRLAGGTGDATVRLWATDADAAARDVCAGAGAPLDVDEWERLIPDLPFEPPCG